MRHRDERTDDALLAAHLAGDATAFTELARRYQDRLWSIAFRTVANREDAADAVQDALLAAYKKAATFRGDSALSTWLYRIVVNACLDQLRRRRSRPTVALDTVAEQATPGDQFVDAETAHMVHAALAQLSIELRLALVLVDIEDYPVADAAQILNVPIGTVKSRCSRGRAQLAAILKPQWPAAGGGQSRPEAESRNQDAAEHVSSTWGQTPHSPGGGWEKRDEYPRSPRK